MTKVAVGVCLSCCIGHASLAAAPAPPTRHDVVVDGHHLAVWEKRTGAPKAAILLIHGRTWSSLPNFDLQVAGEQRSLMDALVAAEFDVFAVDLRGYGGTPRDATGWLTPDRAVADVLGVVAWIHRSATAGGGEAPVFLFGFSRGAMIAAMAAQQRRDGIAGVILYGFGFDPDYRAPVVRAPAKPPRLRNDSGAAASDFTTRGSYTDATVVAFVKAALQDDPYLVDWRDEHEFNRFVPSHLHVPVLLVHGDRDPQAPFALEDKLFTRFGTADKWWVVLPEADHAAHLEKAATELVRVTTAFVARLDNRR